VQHDDAATQVALGAALRRNGVAPNSSRRDPISLDDERSFVHADVCRSRPPPMAIAPTVREALFRVAVTSVA
jgi:hypothetical protein